jgi:hypothetical protein
VYYSRYHLSEIIRHGVYRMLAFFGKPRLVYRNNSTKALESVKGYSSVEKKDYVGMGCEKVPISLFLFYCNRIKYARITGSIII